jgi:hypothetical protein
MSYAPTMSCVPRYYHIEIQKVRWPALGKILLLTVLMLEPFIFVLFTPGCGSSLRFGPHPGLFRFDPVQGLGFKALKALMVRIQFTIRNHLKSNLLKFINFKVAGFRLPSCVVLWQIGCVSRWLSGVEATRLLL